MDYNVLKNARDLIGVSSETPEKDMKKIFNRKALENHPDTNFNDSKEVATEKMKELNAAREIVNKTYEPGFVEPIKPVSEEERREEQRQRYEDQDKKRQEQQREWERIKNEEARSQSEKEAARVHREREDAEWMNKKNVRMEYEKVRPTLHTNLRGISFIDNLKQRSKEEELAYYASLEDILQRMGGLNVLSKYQASIDSINSSVTQEEIKLSLIKRAKTLLNLYYFASELMDDKEQYQTEMKKCLRIVIAILENKETISELDTELNEVRSQINSQIGQELWNELIQENDLSSRLDVIKAILGGKNMEEIYTEFKEKAEHGREYLESIGRVSNILNADFSEPQNKAA